MDIVCVGVGAAAMGLVVLARAPEGLRGLEGFGNFDRFAAASFTLLVATGFVAALRAVLRTFFGVFFVGGTFFLSAIIFQSS